MDDRRSQMVWLNSVFIAVSIISVTTRLLIRVRIVKLVGADDVLITIALFLSLAQAACSIVTTTYGEGLHIQYLDPANLPAYSKVILLTGFFVCLSQMFIRLSYLTFYLRLAISLSFRIIIYISIASVSSLGIANSIAFLATCIPWEALWNPDISGQCVNARAFYIAGPSLSVIFDLVVFILPIPLLWSLRLPRRQRVALVGIFAVGLIVIVMSIIRLYSVVRIFNNPAHARDITWSSVNSMNWTTVELHLAILISCTAAFKTLIQRYFPGVFGSLSASKQGLSQQQYNFNTQGRYLRQPRSRDKFNFNSVIQESIHEPTENGSQERIIEDVELSEYNATTSVRAATEAGK